MNADERQEVLNEKIAQYLDFMFSEAVKQLSTSDYASFVDITQEAQDLVQTAVTSLLEKGPTDPSNIGPNFFKEVIKSDFLDWCRERNAQKRGGTGRSGRGTSIRTIYIDDENEALARFTEEDRHGFVELRDAVLNLPRSEKSVVIESYLGYRSGSISGLSKSGARAARMRAASKLAAFAV